MSKAPAPSTTVISTLCTHVLHEADGLELVAGVPTPVPPQHLARVLELPGVVSLSPTAITPSED